MKLAILMRGALASALLVAGMAWAQAPAKADAKPAAPAAAAPAAEAPAAKSPPALPAGSTAAVGWNNPPKWSEVEQKPNYASVAGRETNVLVEDHGHVWRSQRNNLVTYYGGIATLVVPALLVLLYLVKGPIKLSNPRTGKLIERFNSMDRMAHWSVAISFLVLALTGMVTLFGKYVLLPVFGASLFANIAQITTVIHNFVGPLFIFSLIVMFFVYVKDNFMGGSDFAWITHATGLFSHHQVPSGRFNGMEKVWFWMATLVLGVIISVSGLILLFPNWNTSREIMAGANIFHSVTAVVFLAGALAHIYMGIATEGAMEGMKEGYVDESWAKEHHELWYNEVQSGKPAGGNLAAQPAAGDD